MNNPVNIASSRQRQSGLVLHGVRNGHLGLLALGAGLVAELHERHQHGQHEAADQNVEDARHVTQ